MTKTTTMHHRWLRLKRHARLSGPRAAQRRALPWMALPLFTETIEPPGRASVPEPARAIGLGIGRAA